MGAWFGSEQKIHDIHVMHRGVVTEQSDTKKNHLHLRERRHRLAFTAEAATTLQYQQQTEPT